MASTRAALKTMMTMDITYYATDTRFISSSTRSDLTPEQSKYWGTRYAIYYKASVRNVKVRWKENYAYSSRPRSPRSLHSFPAISHSPHST